MLALLLTSLLQRELARKGLPHSINRMLEELGGIRVTLVVYPRSQDQRKNPIVTCITRMSALHQRIFTHLGLQRFVQPTRQVIEGKTCKTFRTTPHHATQAL